MSIRVLTDRARFWEEALAGRSDVQTGGSLGDPWSSPGTLIVDLAVIKSVQRLIRWVDQASPVAVLVLLDRVDDSKYEAMSALGHRFRGIAVETLCAEQYGALVVWHGSLAVYGHRAQGRPKPTHGPGALDSRGRPVFWGSPEGGTPVSRDDSAVLMSLYRSRSGSQPLWVEPGFPVALPAQPQVYLSLSGQLTSGILCSTRNPDRPGGWDVLQIQDVARMLGYSPSLFSTWSELTTSPPSMGLRTVAQWADNLSSLSPV